MRGRAPIPTRAFRFLLQIAEQEPPTIAATVLIEEVGAEVASVLCDYLLQPARPLAAVDVAMEDGQTSAEVEFDHETGRWSYFHPECGFMDLAAEDLLMCRLDLSRFAALIGSMLGLPASRKPIPLVDSLFWDLGTPRLVGAGVEIEFPCVRRVL